MPCLKRVFELLLRSKFPSVRSKSGKMSSAALSLAVVVLVSPVSAQDWSHEGSRADGPLPELSLRPEEVDYLAVAEAAVDEALAYPPQRYELGAVTTEYPTPEALFAFVRDQIATASYQGSLRTPGGVLAASEGNPQDKAEFLVSLLEELGYDARIAFGPAEPDVLAPLAVGSCSAPLPARDPLALAGLVQQDQLRMEARGMRDFDLISDALPDGVGRRAAERPSPSERHPWVQARINEEWVDLDPSFPDAGFGVAISRPTALGLGGEDPHEVTLAVRVETLTERGLREAELLSLTQPARDLAESRLQLVFGFETEGFGGTLANALGSAMDIVPKYRPIFLLDDETLKGRAFDRPGPQNEADGLGETLDPVTALYLDVTTTTPDGRKRTERRAILDLLPDVARASEIPLSNAVLEPAQGARMPRELEAIQTLIVSNGGLDPSFGALANALAVLDFAADLDELDAGTIDGTAVFWRLWGQAYAIAAASEGLVRLQSGAEGCVTVGQPRVFSFVVKPSDDTTRTVIDWTIDAVDVSGTEDPTRAFEMRLWYATLQSALETTMAESQAGSASGALSTSLMLPNQLAAISPGQEAGPMQREDAEAGYLLLGDVSGLNPTAWWRVDLDTGRADARFAGLGNASEWGGGGVYELGPDGRFREVGDVKQKYPGGKKWDPRTPLERKLDELKDRIKKRLRKYRSPKKTKFANKRSGGRAGAGQEYLTILENVSIPVSYVAGATVGGTLAAMYYYALTKEKL